MEKNSFGGTAMQIGSIAGGNLIGTIATNKIKFLQGNMGRMLLILIGVILAMKVKSEILKGAAIGLAISGTTGFINSIASGVQGLDGFDGMGHIGEVIQAPDGMMYFVNGLGELEPYYEDQAQLGEYYEEPLSGSDETASLS